MVAVTVVLAATAFVLVADVGGNATKPAPEVGITHDDVADRIEIVTAATDANWKRITLKVADDGTDLVLGSASGIVNEPAAAGGMAMVSGNNNLLDTDLAMAGGDFLSFCRDGGTDGAVEIRILDEDSNAIIGTTYRFAGIEACT
jgi:hypothetical protein